MNKIDFITPDLKLSNSVAIVGSSGNLLNNKYGSVINQHKHIIRFNRAPIDGYEDFVGSETHIRVINNHVFKGLPLGANMKNEGPKFTSQPLDFVKKLKNTNLLYVGPVVISQSEKNKYTDVSNNLFIFQYNKIKELKSAVGFSTNKNPTVGLIIVCLCIKNGLKPTLFGFDTDINNSSRTHYWEGRPEAGPCHSISYEKSFLKEMHEKNKLVLS